MQQRLYTYIKEGSLVMDPVASLLPGSMLESSFGYVSTGKLFFFIIEWLGM